MSSTTARSGPRARGGRTRRRGTCRRLPAGRLLPVGAPGSRVAAGVTPPPAACGGRHRGAAAAWGLTAWGLTAWGLTPGDPAAARGLPTAAGRSHRVTTAATWYAAHRAFLVASDGVGDPRQQEAHADDACRHDDCQHCRDPGDDPYQAQHAPRPALCNRPLGGLNGPGRPPAQCPRRLPGPPCMAAACSPTGSMELRYCRGFVFTRFRGNRLRTCNTRDRPRDGRDGHLGPGCRLPARAAASHEPRPYPTSSSASSAATW